MDVWTFVSRESDVSHLSCYLRLEYRLQRAIRGEYAIRIKVANNFVKLQGVYPVGLEASQRVAWRKRKPRRANS
jgi:hypothetical protein